MSRNIYYLSCEICRISTTLSGAKVSGSKVICNECYSSVLEVK